jgi:hypothetical protein
MDINPKARWHNRTWETRGGSLNRCLLRGRLAGLAVWPTTTGKVRAAQAGR